jgi:uncharacterized protein (DUF1684 family)
MRIVSLAVILCAALGACSPKSASQSEAFTLSCAAPFGAEANKASITGQFGVRNVRDETVPGPEGSEFPATVLFPSDEAKRLEIIWQDEASQSGIGDASINREGSVWALPGGVKIGSSMADVEKANGKPFLVGGFGWDYGGYATEWNGGAFDADAATGCRISIRFEPKQDAPEKELLAASGDGVKVSSASPEARALEPRVTRISIGYPVREAP